jgi:hypothetical protein
MPPATVRTRSSELLVPPSKAASFKPGGLSCLCVRWYVARHDRRWNRTRFGLLILPTSPLNVIQEGAGMLSGRLTISTRFLD